MRRVPSSSPIGTDRSADIGRQPAILAESSDPRQIHIPRETWYQFSPVCATSVTAPTTRQKALAVNLDARAYGTFAEIGGGQEVARWFFSVGSTAGTVAKTISAYDMAISDGVYGAAERYVSRQRLEAM